MPQNHMMMIMMTGSEALMEGNDSGLGNNEDEDGDNAGSGNLNDS